MSELVIVTNNHWRDFVYRCDVPDKVLKRDFVDEELSDHFFCYRGEWYHLSQFMRISKNQPGPFQYWDGYHCDSFFSGVLIKFCEDNERFIVGTYTS